MIVLMHFGYICHAVYGAFVITSGAKLGSSRASRVTFPLTHLPLSSPSLHLYASSAWRRLCVCDMDRLGRNEFIGEVRVALKKLREGENKRYNMGLERIAQVRYNMCVCVCGLCTDT